MKSFYFCIALIALFSFSSSSVCFGGKVVFSDNFTVYPDNNSDFEIRHDDPQFNLKIRTDWDSTWGEPRVRYIDDVKVKFNRQYFGNSYSGIKYEDIKTRGGEFVIRDGALKCTLKVRGYNTIGIGTKKDIIKFTKLSFSIMVESSR